MYEYSINTFLLASKKFSNFDSENSRSSFYDPYRSVLFRLPSWWHAWHTKDNSCRLLCSGTNASISSSVEGIKNIFLFFFSFTGTKFGTSRCLVSYHEMCFQLPRKGVAPLWECAYSMLLCVCMGWWHSSIKEYLDVGTRNTCFQLVSSFQMPA